MGVCFKNKSLNKPIINKIKNKNQTKTNENINLKEDLGKDNNTNYSNLRKIMKSQFIIKKIFLNLNDKRKIFMIRYNKFYNKLLGVNIELYKKISGALRIGESNGYGE